MSAQPALDFSSMDDLDTAPVRNEQAALAQKAAAPTVDCPKCLGKGKYTFGFRYIRTEPCKVCKGSGKVKADWEKARAAYQKGEETKKNNKLAKQQAWIDAHPAEWKWINGAAANFQFASDMHRAIVTYGQLTEKQLAAVQKCVSRLAEKNAERNAEMERNAVQAPGANAVILCLQKANIGGHKAPTLRTELATFSLAKPNSKNAGCVYVKAPGRDGAYYGKITPEGSFQPTRECPEDARAGVARAAANALDEAVAYGKKTGTCSCCGRELTDPVSIANGIGPVCASGFF